MRQKHHYATATLCHIPKQQHHRVCGLVGQYFHETSNKRSFSNMPIERNHQRWLSQHNNSFDDTRAQKTVASSQVWHADSSFKRHTPIPGWNIFLQHSLFVGFDNSKIPPREKTCGMNKCVLKSQNICANNNLKQERISPPDQHEALSWRSH